MKNLNELVTLTEQTAKDIIKSLPIALYLKGSAEDLKIKLDTSRETSCFAPYLNTIYIAYKNLLSIASNHEGKLTESNIRGLVYHEVLHTMLTNNAAWETWCSQYGTKEEMNVFEDERIETLGEGYFLGVDFWQNRLEILGKPQKAKTKEHYLFNVVRLHATEGHPELLENLQALIELCKNETYNEDLTDAQHLCIRAYIDKVYKVFEENQKNKQKEENKQEEQKQEQKKKEENKQESNNSDSSNSSEENQEDQSESQNQSEDSSNDSSNEEKNKSENQSQEESEESEENDPEENQEEIKPFKNPLSKKEAEKVLGKITKSMNKDAERYNPTISSVVEDKTTTIDLLKILAQAGAFGCEDSYVQNGYTGDFDPEEKMLDFAGEKKWFVDNDDYGKNGKQEEKLILNIWLDNSGSYSPNDKATNKILRSLVEIEKKLPKFHFNLIKVTDKFKIITKDNYRISDSRGCNALPKEQIDSCYKATHKQGNERDIVLFDGVVGFSPEQLVHRYSTRDQEWARDEYSYDNLKVFNNSNTTFITESSNTSEIKRVCPNALTIEENYNYPAQLKTNIMKALQRLF